MKNQNYITCLGWMFNELNLKGNDALIFALIYGFAQDGESCYKGSLRYIQRTLNISRNTVIKSLTFLEGEGFIKKVQTVKNNVTYNSYFLGGSVSAPRGSVSDKGVVQKLTKGGSVSAPNNTNNNTNKESENALGFLRVNSPQRLEVFMMQYKSKINNWLKFTKDFNNKVILEGIEFDCNKLFARLEMYAGNWILNTKKQEGDKGPSASGIKFS